ncbi:MAG: hypothetical protein PCFJNLEI_01353 [Verrucomicrobiae bacterium]|nr:hypothetical protein [Verrucomicrobiae bacterium]
MVDGKSMAARMPGMKRLWLGLLLTGLLAAIQPTTVRVETGAESDESGSTRSGHANPLSFAAND